MVYIEAKHIKLIISELYILLQVLDIHLSISSVAFHQHQLCVSVWKLWLTYRFRFLLHSVSFQIQFLTKNICLLQSLTCELRYCYQQLFYAYYIYLTVVLNNTNRSTKDIKKFEYEYSTNAMQNGGSNDGNAFAQNIL